MEPIGNPPLRLVSNFGMSLGRNGDGNGHDDDDDDDGEEDDDNVDDCNERSCLAVTDLGEQALHILRISS